MPAIAMKYWLDANEHHCVTPTDKWYLDFANRFYPLVKASPLFKNEDWCSQFDAALAVTLYFQDTISQSGGWKRFSDIMYERYNTYLPFYHLTDNYIPDEINKEDIAFVLWTQKAHAIQWDGTEYTLFDPFDEHLLALSQAAYDLMDESFEDAPISEVPSSGIWVLDIILLERTFTPLPEVTPETILTENARLSLEYSNGKPLLYFATYRELCTFFIETLKWEDNPDSLIPELEYKKEFIVYANAKGILIAHNIAAYFCEEHNPMYDAQRAAKEGYKMLCNPDVCPFDLVKYGIIKGLLPDVQLPFPNGKELLHQNWDFLSRFYLCDFYDTEEF